MSDQLGEVGFFQAAWEFTVAIVHFVLRFVACDYNFVRVDHDDVITSVHMRCVARLVLAAQTTRDFSRDATKCFAVCVNEEPLAGDVFWLCADSFHCIFAYIKVFKRVYGALKTDREL